MYKIDLCNPSCSCDAYKFNWKSHWKIGGVYRCKHIKACEQAKTMCHRKPIYVWKPDENNKAGHYYATCSDYGAVGTFEEIMEAVHEPI